MGWAERAALCWCGTCCVGVAVAAWQRVAAVAPDAVQLADWRGFATAPETGWIDTFGRKQPP